MTEKIPGAAIEEMINISRELGGAVTVEEALHIILENIKNHRPHQTLAALVVNENTNNLTIRNSRNLSYSYIKNFSRLARGSVIDRVLMQHEHVFLNNLSASDPAYPELKLENDFKHICLVPIIHNQRAIGYLHCDRTGDQVFTEYEAKELLLIGYLIGQQIGKFELLFLTRHLARIDEASKALKYHAFLEQYQREAARAKTYGSPLTLMLFSIDNYTQYVTTSGIAAGHALLEEVFHLIHSSVREIDLVGRFAADEFIVCLGGMNASEAVKTMENIRNVVQKQTALFSGAPILISGASMTFNCKEDLCLPLEQIFAKLGNGLILARKQGHNQVVSV
jgi:diguanylate cyclase (GGDEF)-like protein